MEQRVAAFRPLQGMHDNFLTANISDINSLSSGHFIAVLHPTAKEVILGEGEFHGTVFAFWFKLIAY